MITRVKNPSPRRTLSGIGVAPFLIYVSIFLIVPTISVVLGAFRQNGKFTASVLPALFSTEMLGVTYRTVLVALISAVIGSIVGGLVAYVVSTAKPDGLVRQIVSSLSGVLAQFGGVMLAFAFIAAVGQSGVITGWLSSLTNGVINLGAGNWLYSFKGIFLVYIYYQIPLMVLVFLPAVDGMRLELREAASSLGASTRYYWRHVGGPMLLPSFLGSALLLFAEAFSSFATAAALVSQGDPILSLRIRTALTSEVVMGKTNFGFAIALEMIVVIGIVMLLYGLLQRRTARWWQ